MRKTTVHNAAIVGISGYGRHHLEMLLEQARAGRLRLVAAVVVNQAEEAEACAHLRSLGCTIHADIASMLEAWSGRLDLCLLPTPLHLHGTMTAAALRHGANVLVEKPLAATLQEADEMMASAKAAGRWVAVGYQDMYADEVHSLKRMILDGAIGRLRRVRSYVLWPRDSTYYGRNRWAGRLWVDNRWVLDSPLNNAVAHFLMLMLFLAGESAGTAAAPKRLEGELYRAQDIQSFDTACVRWRTAGDVELLFYASHSALETTVPEITLEGSAGRAVWRREAGVTLTDRNGRVHRLSTRAERQARLHMMECIVRRLDEAGQLICPIELAREHTRCIDALHDHVPIRTLSPEWLVRQSSGNGVQTAIRGIESTMRAAWEKGVLLSESGCPWAGPASAADMDNYQHFAGDRAKAEAPRGGPDDIAP